ncbi:tRNA (adenosine(37)-N6)-threonylcarbamoyltransferase complex dimerization subunit type 1 TsaB [candidate division KSB1 bacterium]|nr:tRNA (adenosine(37)-N6)-threonylcarbamoyltransferase complex dimerization subunit type 1 TsaB [candidate division KSB1 bacterium]
MNILSIDTATDLCNVALINDSRMLVNYSADFKRAHAEKLITIVQTVLQHGQVALNELEGIALSIGPGSFTGLRISLAAAKGFCFANGTPIVGVNTLDSLAFNAILWKGMICALIHAQAEEYYMGMYESDSKTITRVDDYKLIMIDDIAGLSDSERLFISPHAERIIKYMQEHEISLPRFVDPESNHISGLSIARLGLDRLNRGERDDPDLLQPFYLKDFKAKKKGEHKIVRFR